MTALHEAPTLTAIYDLLYRLGASASSAGFFYAAHAVYLAAEQPQKLLFVTKWLYPEVARHYRTTWWAVERGIRLVIASVWQSQPELLASLAGAPLTAKPAPRQFISILASHLTLDTAG